MTKTRKNHWLLMLWIKLRGLIALVIVLAGVCVGLLSLLLPFESLYQKRLESFLEEQWNLKVQIEEIEGSWRGYGPYFSLKNLTLSGKQNIQLEAASLSINVYQMLLPGGRTGIDLSINRAELGMIHSDQGATITINDQKDEARFTEMLDRVLTTGSLRVDELILNVANKDGKVLVAGLIADFLLEQDESRRAFKLVVKNDDKNQDIEIKSIGQRTQSLTKDAQWHIQFKQFEISQLNELLNEAKLPQGFLDGALWFTAENGYIKKANGELHWSNPDEGLSFRVKLNHIGDQKNWQSQWHVDQLMIKGNSYQDIVINGQRSEDLSQFKSSAIPVALLTHFATEVRTPSPHISEILNELSGVIDAVELSYDHQKKNILQASLNFNDINVSHPDVDIAGLSGEVLFDEHQASVLLDAQDGHLIVPKLFRDQLNWVQLIGQFDIQYDQVDKQVSINNLWCDCTDFNLQLWMHLNIADKKNMILASMVTDVQVKELWKYWPHTVWKPKTLNWLDESLIKGTVEKGYIFVHGDLVPKSFKKGEADFVSRAFVKDVTNKYRPEWPSVEAINATALFTHDAVYVDVDSATTKGIKINSSKVDIESLETGILTVDMSANARNNQLVNYINQSPLSKNLNLSEKITIGGRQKVNLQFDIPLKSNEKQSFNPKGDLYFNQGKFATEHFSLENINGPVKLDGYDLVIKDLSAELQSEAVKVNGKIATKTKDGLAIDVDISGNLSSEYLLGKVNQSLPIQGQSDWNINIKNKEDELIMFAQSDLSGVTSQLPAPLNKAKEESKLFSIKCTIPCENSMVELNYDNQIESVINTEAGKYHLSQLKFIDPEDKRQNVSPFGGFIKEFNLDQWLSLMSKSDGSAAKRDLPVSEISVTIEKLIFMSRYFESIQLNISRKNNGYNIQIDSEAIKGMVIIADDVKRKGIVAQFSHLNWVDSNEEAELNTSSSKTSVPDIHLWAENFSYLGVPLGALRMEMRNVADGIIVEQMGIKSDLAEINVSGAWHKEVGPNGQSDFNIVMFSEKIADFLQTVGFNAPITNAQTLIKMNALWDGVPSEFDMASVDGELDIKIGRGQVLDQQPGFGRVLGLFNLTNLPRRLILDFRDVLAEGLMFRSMEGHFIINDGVANTEDFLIKASSAKIHIEGDVGFADQSYNQTITIRPQIGKTFPTIGAIAGGPVGAAAGFLVQGLFDKQLKNKNEIIYQVTGTWDEPIIELMSDE